MTVNPSASTAATRETADPLPAAARNGLVPVILSIVVWLLVLPLAVTALATAAGFIDLPWPLAVVDERQPAAFRIHMVASSLALGLAPLAIMLRRRPGRHRPVGLAAIAATWVAGLTALPVALAGVAPKAAVLGFLCQAVVWVGLATCGYVAARAGKVRRHATLMLAMTAVASGAIWTRFAMSAAITLGLDFDLAYPVIVWAAWLVPLGLVLAWRARA